MQENDIIDICYKARSKLEKIRFAGKTIGFDTLKYFPVGCCRITSLIMMHYLFLTKEVSQDDLSLVEAAVSEPYTFHCWLKYKNLHIDITADQFKQFDSPNIIISEKTPWPSIKCFETPFEKQKISPEYEKKIIEVCYYLGIL